MSPLMIWLEKPPISFLVDGADVDAVPWPKRGSEMVTVVTVKGQRVKFKAENLLAVREVSKDEVEEAERQAKEKEAQKAGGLGDRRVSPAMMVPGTRRPGH